MSEINIQQVVGLNMKSMRVAAGWTATYVAKMMGMALQNYSGIEKGKRGLSVKQIDKACEVFHCSPVRLFLPPEGTDAQKIMVQLWAEIELMDRPSITNLFAYAVALNAQRGIKP